MPLQEIPLDLTDDPLPERASRLIEESDRRIDALFATGRNKQFPEYLPGDPELAYRALASITGQDLPLGRTFCEWGSGFGVVTGLASLSGYHACGIEREPVLVAEAESLTKEAGIDATFLCSSYVPGDYESYSGIGGEYLIEPEFRHSREPRRVSELSYDGMGCDIAEIDVFYVYPWPLQQEFMEQLFEAIAVEGAILLTYHKAGEIYAYRKVGEP